jgi:hypothetical protein
VSWWRRSKPAVEAATPSEDERLTIYGGRVRTVAEAREEEPDAISVRVDYAVRRRVLAETIAERIARGDREL